jgi:hypothetical protein
MLAIGLDEYRVPAERIRGHGRQHMIQQFHLGLRGEGLQLFCGNATCNHEAARREQPGSHACKQRSSRRRVASDRQQGRDQQRQRYGQRKRHHARADAQCDGSNESERYEHPRDLRSQDEHERRRCRPE